MELTFPWAPVKALANLAGETDIRQWVNGVWLDSSAPTVHVVAANGAMLGVYRTEEPSTNAAPVFIPLSTIKVCKGFGPTAVVSIDDTGRAAVSCAGSQHFWQDEKHPCFDHRRVIPRSCTGQAQQFNAEFWASFIKVRRDLGLRHVFDAVQVRHNGGATTGPEGALVLLAGVPQFVGTVMSIREPKNAPPPLQAPAWVFERTGEDYELV